MPERLLQLDDVRRMDNAPNVADVFRMLGYNVLQTAQPLSIKDLELPSRSAEAIWDAHLIADHRKGNDSLQVLLFQLQEQEWESVSVASNRMRAIAQSLYRRPSDFLLIGTKENYNHLMLVNPRKSFDTQMNLKVGIRKLLIDRRTPTAYDRDRLEAIATHRLSPQEIYKRQCEAFDVEKLTKEFYRGYKEIFEEVQRVIHNHNKHPYFEDQSRLHQFTQRLLGRVMFLYFLQKKEFLGGDRDFLRNQYRLLKTEPEDNDFYSKLLEPLFFEMLNKQRPNFESPWGKIPYLNGGLFDRDYGEEVIDAAGVQTPETLTLPNSLFDPSGNKSVLKFFNSYNFTVSENVQGDEDVAVDPEMLGKVFENLLAADERGQSGTFYTPRGIVHFMCVESLSRYLADESGVDLEVVKQLAEYETEMPDAELRKLLSTEQTKKLRKALESVKVCDPAVGSGAFPLGMMQVILSVWQAIRQREGGSLKRGSLAMSELKRSIIANNLYGVDIKPEAIEIAKLRMWLSMVVDIPTIDDVEPLPNLDYKLMAGNSLISTINGEHLIPDPTKNNQLTIAVDPVSIEIQKLVTLQKQYFLSQADERKDLRGQILEAEKNVFRIAISNRRQNLLIDLRNLERDLKLMGKLSKAQTQKLQSIDSTIKELDSIEINVARGLRSLDFFQWHLHFNDVFGEKGGFDVVIGNPPYVRHEQIKELKPALQEEYDCYAGTADLFVYFFERGFRLLKSNGNLTYICSNKYMRSGYGEKLRKFLSSEGSIQHLIDFGDAPVFEAIAYPSILQVARTEPKEHEVRSLTWDDEKSVNEFASVFRSDSFLIAQKELTSSGWRLESPVVQRLIEKLQSVGQPLNEFVNGRLYRGIITGFNEAFVVDRATRDQLIVEHPSSADVLKPFLRGRDVKRWQVKFAEQYLIKIESSENKKHSWSGLVGNEAEKKFASTYPAIYERFLLFRDQLIRRDDQGRFYWELRSCKYWREFESSKIVYPNICSRNEFTWDEEGYFTNQKAFIISGSSKYLLGVLNSKVAWWLFDKLLAKLQNGFYEPSAIFMKTVPIPQASPVDHNVISDLAQKCLDAKGQNVAHWEAEINDRVAHLYGLTSEEIKIIEGGQN
ncbi:MULTISPECIES: Eco57I restriction-modification methylase domain-containing protein [Leptolyngbya]|uniref:Eco57I restriction-modification methylase domain-containing protein n=1 Tax=Leptolyngbya TaxID=47251 RepID=UPI001685B785|nr:TaqI-like C-terminal specificity domain-containing protein [Leptolyngbya sp. FACHB-1624]MBD1858593.1 Eco57I restriction-modification methylase domain-containing protein [Leptolyngbya sp. FACHB-1624]